MDNVLLLLGGNIGNKEKTIQESLKHITLECGAIISQSKIYRSEPWGFDAQDFFLNMAVEIETNLDPYHLLIAIHKIEKELGRTRVGDGNYHSRTIDIDIIFYGDRVLNSPDLQIPHPRMHLRRFVLLPLNDIASHYIHPILNVSVQQLLNECPDKLEVTECLY